jgi:c-di-AMP phosphodiesterase-like protein
MTRTLKIIYFLSIFPLLIGSLIFYYWYCKRNWYAEDFFIEMFAFFAIIVFLLFALIAMVLCVFFLVKNRTSWRKIVVPLLLILLTFPVIDLYATIQSYYSNKAFVRIINDTDKRVDRIWSDNFVQVNFTEKDFVVSYFPVYIYNWTNKVSSGRVQFKVNPLYIDIGAKGDSVVTYNLPEMYKGDCEKIKLSEIIKNK